MTVSNVNPIDHSVAATVINLARTADGSPGQNQAYVLIPVAILDAVESGELQPADVCAYANLAKRVNAGRAARGDTTVWPTREKLAAEMGYAAARTVDKHVTRLTESGYVSKATQRRGMTSRNVYTVHKTRPARSVEKCTTAPPAQTRKTPASRCAEKVPPVVTKTSPELKEFELKERSSLSAPERELAKLGVPQSQRRQLVAAITARNNVRSDGWWITARQNGTLRDRINELGPQTPVADQKKAAWHAYRETLSTAPQCGHGIAGGGIPSPDGIARCYDCRHARVLVAA